MCKLSFAGYEDTELLWENVCWNITCQFKVEDKDAYLGLTIHSLVSNQIILFEHGK